jgi:hypothetical protein
MTVPDRSLPLCGYIRASIVALVFIAAMSRGAASQQFLGAEAETFLPDTTTRVSLFDPGTRAFDFPPSSTFRPWRMATVAGASAAAAFATFEFQRTQYWSPGETRFRIINDWEYVKWTDKAGHFYSAALLSRAYRAGFRWSGMSEPQARLWGAAAGLANMMYYEVLDGFGPQWGFSPGDALFNTLGAGWAYAKWTVPALEPVDLKLSYRASGWEGRNITDDYEGHTWWLTANLKGIGAPTPDWLGLAVGYGVRDRDERDFLTTPHVYFGLDIDPSVLPIEGRLWDSLLPWLRHVRLPAPAVRLTPEPKFFLVFF